METRLGQLRLANPVIGAAGTSGGLAGHRTTPANPPLGALVTASLSYRRRVGRPPRVAESAAGAIYVPGAARTGIRPALRRHARTWAASPSPVVVSLVDE